ncbi:MAG: HAD-IA family hydrolase [Solirubrobacteraceae bacterium]|jgi:putative hydrolase of the HAD superfamily
MHPERISPPRAVFLDALGTLIRMDDPTAALCGLLAERHAIRIERPDARRALLAEMVHYRGNCVSARDRETLGALRAQCAEIIRTQLAPTVDRLSAAELLATLLDALHFEPFADAAPALRRWRAAGLSTVVVSNWDVSLHDVLDATGLRPLLDGVVCSAEVGRSKPDPAVFRAALEIAGVEPSEAVHIGDSAEDDVAGARAAGIAPILLRRDSTGPNGPVDVPTIVSLGEW